MRAPSSLQRNARSAVLRIGSIAVALAALWLIAFHAILLWRRFADATIADPSVLVRWLGAAALGLGAVAFHRFASIRWRGRHATLIFWLLVAVLHFAAPADERLLDNEGNLLALAQLGLASLPAALATVALVAGSVATLLLGTLLDRFGSFEPSAIHLHGIAPRAPPLG